MKAKRQEVHGLNDKRLIIKLKKRSDKALEKLVQEYSAYVYTIVRNILGGAFTNEDAEEVTSDVFFSIWKSAESLDEDRKLSPYLAACARNCALNRLRSAKLEIHSDELMADLVSGQSVENELETAQQIELVSDRLEELSKDDKEIFVRFYYYGEKLADISARLGISENACKTRLSRTRKKLRDHLTERGYYRDEKAK